MDYCWEDSTSTIILPTLISNIEEQHNQITGITLILCMYAYIRVALSNQ